MARGRFLNKTVATDEKVAFLMQTGGPLACLFHHRIIAFLDVNGNVRADQFWLKATLFPRDSVISPEDCRNFSVSLAECDLAVFYEIEGMLFLHFKNFEKNQHGLRKDKERPEYPEYKQEVGILTEKVRKGDGMLTGISLSLSLSQSQSLSQPSPTDSPDLPEPKSADATWMSEIVTQWNKMASELGYSKIDKLTAQRKKKLLLRKKDETFDFPKIIQAFKDNRPEINNGRLWKPNFDYVIRDDTAYTKILEGEFKSNGNANGAVPTKRAGHLGGGTKVDW